MRGSDSQWVMLDMVVCQLEAHQRGFLRRWSAYGPVVQSHVNRDSHNLDFRLEGNLDYLANGTNEQHN
jgi:hypothetical protein